MSLSFPTPPCYLQQPQAPPGFDLHFHRLQRKLLPLQAFQRVTVKYTPSAPVSDLLSLSSRNIPSHEYFDLWRMVPFWEIVWGHGQKESAWLSKAVGKDLPTDERKAMRFSVYMRLKCTFSSATLRALVSDILKDDAAFSHVEQWRVQPRPRLLLFDLSPGPLNNYLHDVLVIRMHDHHSYVLDVSGPQFGYNRCFFGLLEYTQDFVSCLLPLPYKMETKAIERSWDVNYVIELAKRYREQWQDDQLKGTWNTVEDLPDQQWEALSKDFVLGWKGLVCERLQQAEREGGGPFFPTEAP